METQTVHMSSVQMSKDVCVCVCVCVCVKQSDDTTAGYF